LMLEHGLRPDTAIAAPNVHQPCGSKHLVQMQVIFDL
jgi:hypothetical protein